MAAILNLNPIITTTHGKVRGRQRKTVYDDDFYCFDGIPYAKPPLGELRFKSPQAVEPWHGVLDCTEVKPKCLHWNAYTRQIEGIEDCLYLNIYVKSFRTPKPLPVMVWIYGGAFSTGDASRKALGPDYFMMKEIIFITIGFRSGPLGFLSLKDPALKVPGNAGIKDQVAALRWIRANCAFFNGDPENITVLGHSSGSVCTHLLMLNPQCIGLFHKAVLQSGYDLDFHDLPNMSYRLAKFIGYEGDEADEQAILDFLTNVDVNKLSSNCDILTAVEKDLGFHIPFLPCIEPYASVDSILLKQPSELLQSTWSNKMPIMIGNASREFNREGRRKELYELYKNKPECMLPATLQLKCELELQRQMAKKLKELHYGDKAVSIENVECTIDLFSYSRVYHPCNRILLARSAKRDNARTYLYRFDFDSPNFNLSTIKYIKANGPVVSGLGHADELSYLFYLPLSFKLARDSNEFKTILRMIDIWTNFAATSNPNCARLAPLVWEPLERNQSDKPHMCLNISKELSFIAWPESEKCKVYDSLYEEGGVRLF